MATVREMAKALGVSAATVSMVLNNKPGISSETRARILDYANRCGYTLPRPAAPVTGGTLCFAIYKAHGRVVADTPFFGALIERIEASTAAANQALSIQYLSAGERFTPKADGIIFLATEMDEPTALQLAQQECPVVMLDNAFPNLLLNTVSIDNRSAIFSAVQHLAAAGHQTIGYLRSSAPIQNFEERFAAFRQACAQAGVAVGQVISLAPDLDESNRDMAAWLAEHTLQTLALIADNDTIAFGAVAALHDAGLELGADYSLIGFDDLPYARFLNLTSNRVFHEALGAEAVRRVLDLQREPEQPPQHILVGAQLRVRGSVRQAAEG